MNSDLPVRDDGFEWRGDTCVYRGIKVGEVHAARGPGQRYKFVVHFRSAIEGQTGLVYPVVLKSRNSYLKITAAMYVEQIVKAGLAYEVLQGLERG